MTQNVYKDTLNYIGDNDLTPAKIQEIAAWMPNFQEHANQIADEYLQALGYDRSYITDIDWEQGFIYIRFETYISNGSSPDRDSLSMPIEYLWDEDKQEKMRLKAEAVAAEKARREEAMIRKANDAQRESDLKRLAELKAKYETEE